MADSLHDDSCSSLQQISSLRRSSPDSTKPERTTSREQSTSRTSPSPQPRPSAPAPCKSHSAPENVVIKKTNPKLLAGVHRNKRKGPQSAPTLASTTSVNDTLNASALRPGVPPPSYAEATGHTTPPIRQWAGRSFDSPPVYSSRRPSPMPHPASRPTVRAVPTVVTLDVTTRTTGDGTERGRRRRTELRIKPDWGPYPMRVHCSRCRRVVTTTLMVEDSEFTHLCALTLCLLGCWPCCLMPYCVTSCRRVWHSCPRCGNAMGVYNPRTPTSRPTSPHPNPQQQPQPQPQQLHA